MTLSIRRISKDKQTMNTDQQREVFILLSGQDSSKVPRNVRHVRCDSSVTEIPRDLFYRCESLVTVELNEGLKVIGERAFFFCTSLRSINFPSTLEEIGRAVFCHCAFSTVELNEGLKVFGESAFFGCPSLTSINFPSTFEVIGSFAFYDCKRLVNAELNEGLKKIGGRAFSVCTSLRSINFPSSLEEIGDWAFYDCKRLMNAELNEGLKAIGEYAFSSCASLRNINFPSSVKRILKIAFSDCNAMVSVELPEGIEEIGDGVFADCYKLRNLFIPSTVTKLGKIFKDLTGSSRPPPLLSQQFLNDDDDCSHLVNALKTRFDGLPIHKLCYFQAHYPTATALKKLQEAAESNVGDDGNLAEIGDVFGMTPFHIAALSTKPNLHLLQALTRLYSANFCLRKDVGGNRPIDYLIENDMPESDTVAKQFLQFVLGDRTKWLGLKRWKDTVMNEAADFPEGWESVESRKKQHELIYSTLVKYENLEALSLLEMFLWSMEMDKAQGTSPTKSAKRQKIDFASADTTIMISWRQIHRVNCGANIVIPNVLPFLD